jgi:hypothetical protein
MHCIFIQLHVKIYNVRDSFTSTYDYKCCKHKFTTIQSHNLENVRKLLYYIRIRESSVSLYASYKHISLSVNDIPWNILYTKTTKKKTPQINRLTHLLQPATFHPPVHSPLTKRFCSGKCITFINDKCSRVADTDEWWLERNMTAGKRGKASCIAICTIHAASLSCLSTDWTSILKQSWEKFYNISPRPKVRIDTSVSQRTTHSFLYLNIKQKGDLSWFPNQSFSQQFYCCLDVSQSSTTNMAKLTAELLKAWKLFLT